MVASNSASNEAVGEERTLVARLRSRLGRERSESLAGSVATQASVDDLREMRRRLARFQKLFGTEFHVAASPELYAALAHLDDEPYSSLDASLEPGVTVPDDGSASGPFGEEEGR